MILARYWVREELSFRDRDGRSRCVSYWGWSETSEEEARQRARQGAQRAMDRLLAEQSAPEVRFWNREQAPKYGYGGDRPLREQIVEEITDDRGELLAAITRNRMGALVLNTRDLMFIDVDFPAQPLFSGLGRLVKRLLGFAADSVEQAVQERIEQQLNELGHYRARLYRTRQGFRCAIVDRPISPGSSESELLLEKLQSDPLYVQLCKTQQCYRARLTPKFWRCGIEAPPGSFPWQSAEDERAFQDWDAQYKQVVYDFGTCRLVKEIGTGSMPAEFQRLVDLHDRITRAEEDLPLA